MEIALSHNKRLSFVGKTRSGKTFLAKHLIKQVSRRKDLQVIFLDPKFERVQFGDGSSIDAPKLVKTYNKKIKFQCFQSYHWTPALEDMVDALLKRGNAVVDLDEIGGIATATSVPDGITRLCTQGAGKGIGFWAKYQQPKRVPRVIKSQSEYFFLFRLNPQEDREDMLAYIPDKQILQKIPLHYFWLYQDELDEAILVKPIVIKGNK